MGQDSSASMPDESVLPRSLSSRSIDGIAEYIKNGKAKKVVVLTGAGISTSAGIPDFRSPDTGLYANLARLNLPYAEAVFDISYFRQNPEPFYALARELYPGKFTPTPGHAFIALLARKGMLKMLFTQNIDCLERAAGVPDWQIVEAHGSFATQRCIECRAEYPDDLMKQAIAAAEVPRCMAPQCNSLVKPDIVFFGESLPAKFFEYRQLPEIADLVIIMGTSLAVYPFAMLPQIVRPGTPRLLINKEPAGDLGQRRDDVCLLTDIDAGVRRLADALGWRDELEALWKQLAGTEAATAADTIAREKALSKDEALEAEIDKLTKEVEQTLDVSDAHAERTAKELEKSEAKSEAKPEKPVEKEPSEKETSDAQQPSEKETSDEKQPSTEYRADALTEESKIARLVATDKQDDKDAKSPPEGEKDVGEGPSE